MNTLMGRFRSLHRAIGGLAFDALALASLLACAILATRVRLSHSPSYIFLIWNLFLAWVPFVCSQLAAEMQRRAPAAWWRLLLPGALWLLFFPNAVYLVTDFVHLRAREGIPLWFDIGMLAAFAWSGCFLAVVSLRTMQALVARYLGAALSWLFVAGVFGLNGLGIYLGRFLRWNSWDVFTDPHGVLHDVAAIVAHPLANRQATGVTALFAMLLLVCYMAFYSFEHRAAPAELPR